MNKMILAALVGVASLAGTVPYEPAHSYSRRTKKHTTVPMEKKRLANRRKNWMARGARRLNRGNNQC